MIGGAATAWYTSRGRSTEDAAATSVRAATADVVRRDLAELVQVDGRLGYGAASTVAARTAGTVTWVAPEGSLVEVGKPVAALDGRPMVVMAGNVALWRTLGPVQTKDELADLRQKQTSLATADDQLAAARQAYTAAADPGKAKRADAAATLADAEAKAAAARGALQRIDTTTADEIASKQAAYDSAVADRKRAEDDLAKAVADEAATPANAIEDAKTGLADAQLAFDNARLDFDDSVGAVKDAEAGLDRAKVAVTTATQALNDATAAVADAKRALETAGVVVDPKPGSVSTAEADVRNAKATLRNAEATERTAKDTIEARESDVETSTRSLERAQRTMQRNKEAIERADRARAKAERAVTDAERSPAQQAAATRSAQLKLDAAKASEELARVALVRATEKVPGSEETAQNDAEVATARAKSAAAAKAGLVDPAQVASARAKLEAAKTTQQIAAMAVKDAEARLTTTPGEDVKAVEQFLVDIGVAKASDLGVDETWTPATTAAVKRWQHTLGVTEDGTVRAGDLVPSGSAKSLRVQARKAAIGANVSQAAPILETTEAVRKVTVDLDVKLRAIARPDAPVMITLPDSTKASGRITKVGAVAVAGTGDQASKRTVTVDVALDSEGDGWDGAPVTATFTGETRSQVLVVPVNALVALSGGGYGVEKMTANARQYVRVETGLYADGMVEITRGAIAPGDKVVVAT